MLEQEVEKLIAIMESLTAKRVELLAEADELEAQGITDGRPDWNRKKYLYLRFPTQSGERARQYIGSDPVKTDAALQMVERSIQHKNLLHHVEQIDAKQEEVKQMISDLRKSASRLLENISR